MHATPADHVPYSITTAYSAWPARIAVLGRTPSGSECTPLSFYRVTGVPRNSNRSQPTSANGGICHSHGLYEIEKHRSHGVLVERCRAAVLTVIRPADIRPDSVNPNSGPWSFGTGPELRDSVFLRFLGETYSRFGARSRIGPRRRELYSISPRDWRALTDVRTVIMRTLSGGASQQYRSLLSFGGENNRELMCASQDASIPELLTQKRHSQTTRPRCKTAFRVYRAFRRAGGAQRRKSARYYCGAFAQGHLRQIPHQWQ